MDSDEAFQIFTANYNAISRAWEAYLVPITRVFAAAVIEHAQLERGERVLDVGTGTGVGAFLAASRVGASGQVVGVDVAEAMLQIAQQKSITASYDHVEFHVRSAASVDFASERFDVVLSNLGLQILNEESLQSLYRVLRPGGRIIFNLWGSAPSSTGRVYDAVFSRYKVAPVSEALARFREAEAVIQELEKPFRGDSPATRALLAQVGFQSVTVEKKAHRVLLPDVAAYLNMTRYVNAVHELQAMPPDQRERFLSELGDGLQVLMTPEGLPLDTELFYYRGFKA